MQNMINWENTLPYNNLPKLPPRVQVETIATLKKCIGARAAIGALKQAASLIPNQGILISLLPILEAQASSEVENIVTTTDKLFRHMSEHERNIDPSTKEALRYSRAIYSGFKSVKNKPISTNIAQNVCSIIKGRNMDIRKTPGAALANNKTGEIIYTPPEGENLIRELMYNWERFVNETTQIDPLIIMAISHYQFEAIHPFDDGNGRTGRILNGLYLIQEGLLDLPILYLSRYIISQKQNYYILLQRVTEKGEWNQWIEFMLDGVKETAEWTVKKISAIKDLMQITKEYVREKLPKAYSHELINLLFELPYCRISNVVSARIAKRQTASIYMNNLVKIGVLMDVSVGKEKLFVHKKLLELISSENNEVKAY